MAAEIDKPNGPRTMKASEFKAKCLKLMDEVAEGGAEIIITKNGRPISRLAPYLPTPKTPFGRDRDVLQIHGDIMEPVDVEWEVMAGTNQGGRL